MGIVRSVKKPTYGKGRTSGEDYSRQFFNVEIKFGNIVKFVAWGDDFERFKDAIM